MEEIWKDIDGYNGQYQISNLGNVRSFKAWLKEYRPVKPRVHTGGYLRVCFFKVDKYIHRLVAQAFLQTDPLKPEVNHKDCDRKNNQLTNLEWCSHGENIAHGYKMGTRKNPGAGKIGKLNVNSTPVIAIKDTAIIECDSLREMGDALGRKGSSVWDALRNGHKCNGYTLYHG